MSKSLVEMTVEIVAAQARLVPLSPDVMASSVRKVFETLQEVQHTEPQEAFREGMFRNPEASIQEHQVICVECGKTFTLLSNRHLALHGLTPRTYKQKHGIRLTQPLSARSLTAHRRRRARESGMGKQLAEWRSAHQHKSIRSAATM